MAKDQKLKTATEILIALIKSDAKMYESRGSSDWAKSLVKEAVDLTLLLNKECKRRV